MTRPTNSLVWPTLAALVSLAILIGLGTWQLQRLAWKEALIAAVAERSAAEPAAMPGPVGWASLVPADIEYRRVYIEGSFRHDEEIAVFTALSEARGRFSGPGWWIMTPLVIDGGATVWINRGFVPSDRRSAATRAEGQIEGRVRIVGLMRWSEDRNLFTPADDASTATFYTRDVEAMAEARGVTDVAPFFIDAEETAPGGLPQGGETRLAFPNRHFEYALTWYGLALSLVGVYAVFAYRRWRRL